MTRGQEILNKLLYDRPKGNEWLKLRDEIYIFLDGDYPEEEKKDIMQYTEMVYMMCSAIENIR